jgi:hypothetical protein
MVDLGIGDFRENGQTQATFCRALGHRKIARSITQIGKALLQVQGLGIMKGGANSVCVQVVA